MTLSRGHGQSDQKGSLPHPCPATGSHSTPLRPWGANIMSIYIKTSYRLCHLPPLTPHSSSPPPHSASATQDSLLFLQHTKPGPASGPLHVLFPHTRITPDPCWVCSLASLS